MSKNNKGFSLVELIIVIAIMAILVGVMAPQLIKYIEKANVSSDTQLCDTVHSAIAVTLSDPAMLSSSDVYTKAYISYLTTPNFESEIIAGPQYAASDFAKAVGDICGFNPFETDAKKYFKSAPAKSSGELWIKVDGTGNNFVIYIKHSDKTGKKSDYTAIGDVICAPDWVTN